MSYYVNKDDGNRQADAGYDNPSAEEAEGKKLFDQNETQECQK